MYCKNCGTLIPEGSKFCPSCGTSVVSNQGQPMNAGPANMQPNVQPNPQMLNQQPNGYGNQPYVQQKKSNSTPIIIAVVAVVLLAIICIGVYVKNSSPRHVILGKWQTTSDGETLKFEFKTDNTLIMTMDGESIIGSYEFSSDNKNVTLYESKTKSNGESQKAQIKIVDKNTVKLTDKSGETIVLDRIK